MVGTAVRSWAFSTGSVTPLDLDPIDPSSLSSSWFWPVCRSAASCQTAVRGSAGQQLRGGGQPGVCIARCAGVGLDQLAGAPLRRLAGRGAGLPALPRAARCTLTVPGNRIMARRRMPIQRSVSRRSQQYRSRCASPQRPTPPNSAQPAGSRPHEEAGRPRVPQPCASARSLNPHRCLAAQRAASTGAFMPCRRGSPAALHDDGVSNTGAIRSAVSNLHRTEERRAHILSLDD